MNRFLQWLPKTSHPLSLRAFNLACANVSGFALWNQPFYAKLYFKATASCSYLVVPYLLTTGTWQTHKVVQTLPSKNRSCWGAAVFRTTQAGETWPVIFLLRILQLFRAGCLAKLQTNWISPLLACIFFEERYFYIFPLPWWKGLKGRLMKALVRAECISRFHCRWSLRTGNSMQVKEMENSMQRIHGVLVRMYLALIFKQRTADVFVVFSLLSLMLHLYSMMFAVNNNNNNSFSKQLVHYWNLPWFTRMASIRTSTGFHSDEM